MLDAASEALHSIAGESQGRGVSWSQEGLCTALEMERIEAEERLLELLEEERDTSDRLWGELERTRLVNIPELLLLPLPPLPQLYGWGHVL